MFQFHVLELMTQYKIRGWAVSYRKWNAFLFPVRQKGFFGSKGSDYPINIIFYKFGWPVKYRSCNSFSPEFNMYIPVTHVTYAINPLHFSPCKTIHKLIGFLIFQHYLVWSRLWKYLLWSLQSWLCCYGYVGFPAAKKEKVQLVSKSFHVCCAFSQVRDFILRFL